ncbi:MAG: agmatinase [Pseudomonadota bacterium]|jgi:agmatinase|nr:agmatinase [Pseudomonadota bacterium]
MSIKRPHPRQDLLGTEGAGMTFGGQLSFLRRQYTQDIAGADVVISGLPFDVATTFRPGARLGPQAIRAASVQLAEISSNAFPYKVDPFASLAVADYGDCYFDSGYPEHAVEVITAHARKLLLQDVTMLSLGGDHFVTYPLLKAHAEKYGPLSLIHFDAHVDTWPDDGKRLDHGSMFLRAKNEGLIDSSRSIQLGIRSFSEDDYGFTVLTAPWIQEHGSTQAISEIRRVVGEHKAYLTFDIDCLDPAFAPGTGTPVAGGLTSSEAFAIFRAMVDFNIIGMDIVEVAPAYDHAEITAIAAATLAHDFICQLAIRKTAQHP